MASGGSSSRARTPSKPRCVALITGTRSEFGILETILAALHEKPSLRPQLIVTGMHLLKRFGHTIDDIRAAGWKIDATVRMQSGRDDPASEAQAVGRGIEGIADAFDRLQTDTVFVIGDRIEAFAGAAAACAGRRLLLHSHGGDRALGDVDDRLREAITRLAHVHLPASADAVRRLRRMGEQPSRIHKVGAPGLDAIREFRETARGDPAGTNTRLRRLLDVDKLPEYALVIQHPCGRSAHEEARTMRHILDAVGKCRLPGVLIYPNSDPGHSGIVREIERRSRSGPWWCFRSLPRRDYLLLASGAAVLVGNSSSGIIESASLGVPAVNVGPRQAGRLRCAPSIIDTSEKPEAISRAIRKALRAPRPPSRRSVYGDGHAGKRIADIIERLIITPQLMKKGFTF